MALAEGALDLVLAANRVAEQIDNELIGGHIAIVGLRAPAPVPLPDPKPGWELFSERWTPTPRTAGR